MNAKEISDSTLESVTPADDDLLLIYDTSEGTTGKATIEDIAPKVAKNIDIENFGPQIDSRIATNINNVIKRGFVTIPESISGINAVQKEVIFDIPFDDTNYVIELTRDGYDFYADTSIVYTRKTKNGFVIEEFCNYNQYIRPAHQASWVAIKI